MWEGPQVERFDGLDTSLSASNVGRADFLTEYRYNGLHRVQSIRQSGQGGNAVAEKRVKFSQQTVAKRTAGVFSSRQARGRVVRGSQIHGAVTISEGTARVGRGKSGWVRGLGIGRLRAEKPLGPVAAGGWAARR